MKNFNYPENLKEHIEKKDVSAYFYDKEDMENALAYNGDICGSPGYLSNRKDGYCGVGCVLVNCQECPFDVRNKAILKSMLPQLNEASSEAEETPETSNKHNTLTDANNVLCEVVFTKDMFIKAIHEIEKQCNHDRKCSDAFKVILPNDYTSNYDNHWLQNQLIEILQIAMNDNHKDSWIEYYMWELDFGLKYSKGCIKIHGKDFRLKTASDLWDLLNVA